MRYSILLILTCFSTLAAEPTNNASSLDAFVKMTRESYEKKDGETMLKHFYTNGVPAEIATAQEQFFRQFWGYGDLKVTSVETFRYADYKPTAAPGEFNGKKLRYVIEPSHWLVLKAESPPTDKKKAASTTQIKMEFAIIEKDGQWKVIGPTYAN